MVRFFNFEFFSWLESALGTRHGWTMDPRKAYCREFMFRWRVIRKISLLLMAQDESSD